MSLSDRAVMAIDEVVAARELQDHPFMLAWSGGDLSRDDLRAFAGQFFHLVDALPRCVSRIHASTADVRLRRPLVGILTALDGQPPTPADLWLQTCASLGLFSDSVRSAPIAAGAEQCLFALSRVASSGPVEGLAALYALLRGMPVICRLQREALNAHYGMHGGPGLAFFDSFGYQADAHTRTLRELLTLTIDSEAATFAAQSAANEALDAFSTLLSTAVHAPLATV